MAKWDIPTGDTVHLQASMCMRDCEQQGGPGRERTAGEEQPPVCACFCIPLSRGPSQGRQSSCDLLECAKSHFSSEHRRTFSWSEPSKVGKSCTCKE